jgi:lactoylglutathione lyase
VSDSGLDLLLRLSNLGAKVSALDSEIEFFVGLGAEVRYRDTASRASGDVEFVMMRIGDVDVMMTPEPVFEAALGSSLSAGWSHLVFETPDLDRVVEVASGGGAEVLVGPFEATGAVGTIRVLCVRSPGGVVVEFIERTGSAPRGTSSASEPHKNKE